MSTLDDWLDRVAHELSVTEAVPDTAGRTELLDLTREIAHGVTRIAGPLSCYLLGVAVAGGRSLEEAVQLVRELIPAEADSTNTPGAEQAE